MISAVPRRALVLLSVLTLIWGTNWPLFPLAMRELSVWTFRTVSLFGAGSVLLLVARLRGLPLSIPRGDRGAMLLASFSYLVVWNVASAFSAISIPSGQSAVLGFTMPLWAALLSWLFFGERLSGRALLALGLGAAGVLLLLIPGLTAYARAPLGFAAGLIAAIGWAVGTILYKRRPIAASATVITGWQLLLASLPIAVFGLIFTDRQVFMPSTLTIAVVGYVTVVPMALGNLCWFSIVGMLPANVAGLSAVMVPVVAMISGALVRGEPLGPPQIAAMLCCCGAVALSLLQPPAREPA